MGQGVSASCADAGRTSKSMQIEVTNMPKLTIGFFSVLTTYISYVPFLSISLYLYIFFITSILPTNCIALKHGVSNSQLVLTNPYSLFETFKVLIASQDFRRIGFSNSQHYRIE